jgi:diguanylate cyclase (GGDEF)-like protein/PAS domain S-box-containing protein
LHGRQIALLTLVSLIAPMVLMGDALADDGSHAGTVAVFSAALFILVICRLAGIVAVHRQAVLRERVLRSCGEALVSAQTADEVYQATQAAVRLLTAMEGPDRVGLYLLDGNRTRRVAGWGETDTEPDAAWLEASDGGILTDAGRTSVSPLRYDGVLRGLLVVRCTRALIPEIHGALCTLASQTALALESIALAATARLLQRDSRFKALIQNASDVLVVLNGDGSIAYGSPSLERHLGRTADALTGAGFQDLLPEGDAAQVRRLLDDLVGRGTGAQVVADWRLRRADGASVAFEVVVHNLLADPNVNGVVLTMRDVSERRELERQLTHQAFHDALTGLSNRALFHDRAQHALARASRRDTHVAMLMLDLDEFKIVNDTLGHAAGDELLIAVAGCLGETARTGDTVARFGGDEFAVLMEDIVDPADAEQVADRIIQRLGGPFTVQGEQINGGASGGLVVVGGQDGELSLPDLLRNADLALYEAKSRGRGVVVLYHDDLHVRMMERVTRKSDLRRAVDEDQFILHYQPIVSIETGEVVGCEALVRWQHPQRGLVGPQEFITVAEETGLIVDLGRWVFGEAARQAEAWSAIVPGLRMSINVSGRQLQHRGFLDDVAEILHRHAVAPGTLVVELTESVLMRDGQSVPQQLRDLHELGALVAIDDFGVGYSSLGYLQRFPIDILKIDKSFIDNLGTGGAQGGALARAVVSLAHALGLEAVAEGIERADQRDELWALGCPLGQGYLYARPLEPAAMAAVLAGENSLGPPPPRVGHRNPLPRGPRRPASNHPEPNLIP